METSNCDSRPPAPQGSVCQKTNCLIPFDGYWWWTNYPFNISGTGYWFNDQQWDPNLPFVDNEGLHLRMQQTTIPGGPGPQWSSVELVLWGKASDPNHPGAPPPRYYPGYGKYLVAVTTPKGFNDLANNCCFGAFTYRFDQDNSQRNPYHELDMIEISRWDNKSQPTNAQFTLQPWNALPNDQNVHRIILKDNGKITLFMNWAGPGIPVKFSVYYGLFDMDNLPATPDITWTTAANQNPYIPTNACQTVHFNLWRQPPDKVFPSQNQEVIVKKFQYRPA